MLGVVWKVLTFLLLSVVLHWVGLSNIRLGLSLEREEAVAEEGACKVCLHRLARAGYWPAGSCQREKTTFSPTSFTNQQATLWEQPFLCEVESWEQTSLVVRWLKKSPASAGDTEEPTCHRATEPVGISSRAPEPRACVSPLSPHTATREVGAPSPAPARGATTVRSPHT